MTKKRLSEAQNSVMASFFLPQWPGIGTAQSSLEPQKMAGAAEGKVTGPFEGVMKEEEG